MADVTVRIECCVCDEHAEVVVPLPEGFMPGSSFLSDSAGFCPKHRAVEGFLSAQCPGCMLGWGDCPMWQAVQGEKRLTGLELREVTDGYCPKRVNGTSGFVPGRGFEKLDLSERAPAEAGQAMLAAIRERQP